MSIRTLGLWWRLCWDLSVVSVKAVHTAAEGFLCVRPGLVGLLFFASLLLPQQLLGLQQDAGVEAGRSEVSISRSLAARQMRVLLGCLELLGWH